MIDNYFFSVIVPLYNKEQYINETLKSILKQTFQDFEIIVIDDGSTDSGCEIVKSIEDPRIRLIHQDNGGPSKARNRGIKEARGKYIAFLDADDSWLPEKLERQHQLLLNSPGIVWSCSSYKIIGGIKEKTVRFSQAGVLPDAIDALVEGLSIWTSTVVIKKDVFKNDRLLFNENFSRSEDREVWYKLACLYPEIGYINEELAIYNIKLDGSLTNTATDKEDFSFLSLASRIDKELNSIDNIRKNKLIKKLYSINKDGIIRVWGKKKDFNGYIVLFTPYVDEKLLKFLSYTSFFPVLVRKVIWKVIR
jgi:glycosyltransferase involved in cell wall biosynthesis